jgi:lipopolysaccharide transport system ATP-binding protein
MWALKDVSFEVKQGEIVGIIGRNGAGKSTLLKILSRVTAPTRGEVRVKGRIASLLEVGTGFHPELSGRENIFLNGTILGMTRAEIQKKFDEIVAFAEVEKFLDTPVKRYSSGMYVRLAFGVAAHLEPEILLVDEVLAVGDAAFQKKCLGKMGDVAKTGRTVLFVTHNMGSVQGLCERVIWLEKGRVEVDGEPEETVQNYLDRLMAVEEVSGILTPLSYLRIERVLLKNVSGEITNNFRTGESLDVEIQYSVDVPVERPYFWLSIESQCGNHLTANMLLDGFRPRVLEEKGIITCRFKSLPLLPRRYTVHMGVRDKTGNILLVKSGDVAGFNIVSNVRDIGFTGERAASDVWDTAPVVVPYEWHLPDGQVLGIDPLSVNRKFEEAKTFKAGSDEVQCSSKGAGHLK